MNKTISALAMMFVLFAVTVSAATLTVVQGKVTDKDANPVDGASVTVTCTHNSVDYDKTVLTGGDGKYYAFFSISQCSEGDAVSVHVEYGDQTGDGKGDVSYNRQCRINIGIVDVQIPEFGIIAAAVALVGAVGVVVYRRK